MADKEQEIQKGSLLISQRAGITQADAERALKAAFVNSAKSMPDAINSVGLNINPKQLGSMVDVLLELNKTNTFSSTTINELTGGNAGNTAQFDILLNKANTSIKQEATSDSTKTAETTATSSGGSGNVNNDSSHNPSMSHLFAGASANMNDRNHATNDDGSRRYAYFSSARPLPELYDELKQRLHQEVTLAKTDTEKQRALDDLAIIENKEVSDSAFKDMMSRRKEQMKERAPQQQTTAPLRQVSSQEAELEELIDATRNQGDADYDRLTQRRRDAVAANPEVDNVVSQEIPYVSLAEKRALELQAQQALNINDEKKIG